MDFQFQTTSFWAFTIVLMSLTTIPVQLAAHLVGARRTGMYAAAAAAGLATGTALIAYTVAGSGWIGAGAALGCMLIAYKVVLGTHWDSAAVVATTVFALQSMVVWLLALVGVLQLRMPQP